MTRLSDLRKSYERGELDEDHACRDPFDQFRKWLGEAVGANVSEPNAMTVATVGEGGRPSTRVVLIKDFDERGVVWYTNYESRKGRELAGNPHGPRRSVWVERGGVGGAGGLVRGGGAAYSAASCGARPGASRSGAGASGRGRPRASRAARGAPGAGFGLRCGGPPPRPPHWGGFRLAPDYWEFWQGRPSRLHDRLAYRRVPGEEGWRRQRLAP